MRHAAGINRSMIKNIYFTFIKITPFFLNMLKLQKKSTKDAEKIFFRHNRKWLQILGFPLLSKINHMSGHSPKKCSVFIFFAGKNPAYWIYIPDKKKRKEKDNDTFEKNIPKTLQKLHVQESCLA